MRKVFLVTLLGVMSAAVFAQSGGVINGTRGFPVPNDTTTGTTLHSTVVIDSAGKAIVAGTSNTGVPAYIVVGGAGTSGNAVLASSGTLAPCTMDTTIASGAGGYYVVNSTTVAGDCHAQSAAPGGGTWVIGFLNASSTTAGSTALVSADGFVYGGSGSIAAWGGITGTLSSQTDLQAALNAMAPLGSPAFTGMPTAPTQTAGDTSSAVATDEFVQGAISALSLGTVWNVKSNCGATGNGSADDTSAITGCVGHLLPGDTLEFPSGTYKVTSQLTINVPDITVDGSNNTATISNTAGTTIGILVGQVGIGNTNAAIGSGVALSATANEGANSFTTASSLGASVGSYVYLQQGGQASSTGGANYQCDTDGCRGQLVKIAGVSGNTYTVTTNLTDTFVPSSGYTMSKGGTCTGSPSSGNCATAYLVSGMLSGVTIQNINFNGNESGANTGVHYGFEINDLINSTISGLNVYNVQGAAVVGSVLYGNTWNNVTITAAGSAGCGAALTLELESGDVFNTASLSSLNPGAPGTGCLNNGAFGFAVAGAVNQNTYENVTVNSSGTGGGRPVKLDAARYNVFTSLTAENGVGGYDGFAIEYYSSHNAFNNCTATNNAATNGSGAAGINLFANYNQYNTFNNCTVTGNGNVQFVTGNADTLSVVADSNNIINGGTYTGSNNVEPAIISGEPGFYITGVTIDGDGSGTGLSLNSNSSNNCSNSNTFVASHGGISSSVSSNVGSGNTLNSGNSSNLTSGSCPNATQPGAASVQTFTPSSSSLSFGSVSIGSTAQLTLTVTNNGGTGYSLVAFPSITGTNAGDFAEVSNTCLASGNLVTQYGFTLAAGGSCQIVFQFSPQASGSRSASISVNSNALDSPETISLTGTAKQVFTNLNVTGNMTEPDGTTINSSGYSFAHALSLPSGSTATTQTAGDNSTKVATTAYVQAQGYATASGLVSGNYSKANGAAGMSDSGVAAGPYATFWGIPGSVSTGTPIACSSYSSSGNLIAHTGPVAGTAFAPTAGHYTSQAWTSVNTVLQPGNYWVALTCSAISGTATFGYTFTWANAPNTSESLSTGGTLPSSLTVPGTNSFSNASVLQVVIY
jgi:hypothetical protein